MRHDPVTGYALFNGPGINLTPEQRDLAGSFAALMLASNLVDLVNKWDKRWFTRFDAGNATGMGDLLDALDRCGIITEVKSKNGGTYYRHTQYTWPWCRTAQALADQKPPALDGHKDT